MKNTSSTNRIASFFNVFKKNDKNQPQNNELTQSALESEVVNDSGVDVPVDYMYEQSSIEPALNAELLIRSGCYQGFYNAINHLENDYLVKQPAANRLDEVRFITCILQNLPKPQDVSDELNLYKLNLKMQIIEKSYHTLVGACLYIHERIKDDYKGSWSASIWNNCESNSELFKLLDKHLSVIELDVKQLSINQIKMNFLSEQIGGNIAFPIVKGTTLPETKEQFNCNVNRFLKLLCPEIEDAVTKLAV